MYVRLQDKMNIYADNNTSIIPNFILVTLPKVGYLIICLLYRIYLYEIKYHINK